MYGAGAFTTMRDWMESFSLELPLATTHPPNRFHPYLFVNVPRIPLAWTNCRGLFLGPFKNSNVLYIYIERHAPCQLRAA